MGHEVGAEGGLFIFVRPLSSAGLVRGATEERAGTPSHRAALDRSTENKAVEMLLCLLALKPEDTECCEEQKSNGGSVWR